MAFGTELAKLFVRIGADVSELKSGLKEAGSAVDGAANQIKGAGAKLSGAGRALTVGLTAPIVAIGGLALKASIDFESAFAGVRKTVDATEPEFAQLRQGIRDMAKEMPLSASKIAEVAEAAGQLGVQKDDVLAFTKTMVKLGTATNLSATEAATGFARLANIMRVPLKDVDKLADVLVNLGNKGASTEKEILDMALRIAGAAQQIGISAQDVLAFANALSSVGIEAEAGGSAISRTFIEIAEAVSGLAPTPEHLQEIEDATRDVSDASDNLASAQRGVRDAGEDVAAAQRGVRDSVEGVASAQRNSRNAAEALRDAQADLTRAYRDQRQAQLDSRRETLSVMEAQQGLREVQAQAGNQALELRSAQLALADANNRVREAAKKGGLELQQAQLAQAQAQQRLNQVMQQGPRYALDLANANLRLEEATLRRGRARDDQAKKEVDANRNVRNATEGLNDARRNERNANEGVADANRNLRNSYEGVSDAQRNSTKASQEVQDAQKKLNDLTDGSTSKLKLFAEVAGMSVEEFSNLFKKDAKSAVLAFVEGLGRIKESGGDVFGTLKSLGLEEVRQRDALLRLAGAGNVLRQSFEDAASASGALEREFKEKAETSAAQLAIKWNEITDSLITLGDTLKPIMMELLAAAQPFFDAVAAGAEAFANLPGPVQKVVVGLALLAAILGPLLIVIGSLAGAFVAISAAAGIVGISMGALALAFIAIPLLIAAIVLAGYLLYKNWDTIKAAAVSLGQTLIGAFNAVKDYLSRIWPTIGELIMFPLVGLVALATDAFGVRSALWGALKAVWDWVKNNWATIGALISSPFLGLVAMAFDLWGLRSAIESGLRSAWAAISKFFNNLKNIKVKVNTTAGGIVPTGFSVSIPSYEMGTAKVPSDVLAFLHQGEMVVPRGVADQVRNGLPSSMQNFIGGTSATGRTTPGLTAIESGGSGGGGSAMAEARMKPLNGGLNVEINGPVKVQNIGRRKDATGTLGDLAFGMKGQLNRRGIYA